MQLVLPDVESELSLAYSGRPKMTADEFFELCQANTDLWLELTSEGTITVMPPASTLSGLRSGEVFGQLREWVRSHGGWAFDASAGFALPDGAVLSPDASWIAAGRLACLTEQQMEKFIPLAPDLAVELMSRTDRLKPAQRKMEEWMRNGVQLGLLVQPEARTVFVYRAGGTAPEVHAGVTELRPGEPCEGLAFQLAPVWGGLRP